MTTATPKLTPLEHKALSLWPKLSFFDMGIEGGSDGWFNIVTQELTPAVGKTERSTAGVLRSLAKKGMITVGDPTGQEGGVPSDRSIVLTDPGAETIMDIVNGKLPAPAGLKVVSTSGDQPIEPRMPNHPVTDQPVQIDSNDDEIADLVEDSARVEKLTKKAKTNKKPKKVPTPTVTGTRTSHADHDHPSTKAARAICRREMAKAAAKK